MDVLWAHSDTGHGGDPLGQDGGVQVQQPMTVDGVAISSPKKRVILVPNAAAAAAV